MPKPAKPKLPWLQRGANFDADASRGDDITATLTTQDRLSARQQSVLAKHWRFLLSAVCTGLAATAVGFNIGLVTLLERQIQSLFFELRGPVSAPKDIVILAIDEESLSQGQYYLEDPEQYAALQPIESWPWQRRAYAQAISRLLDAGASAVALDIVFSAPSTYGPADDNAFTQVLEQYGDRIVLAANYNTISLRQGDLAQPDLPLQQFIEAGAQIGAINFRKEHNGQIHRLGQEFLREFVAAENDLLTHSTDLAAPAENEADLLPLSFAQATMAAAKVTYNSQPRENVFFHGPGKTFTQIPFWYAIDDDPWRNQLKSGQLLEDKIVIIGTTAAVHQDFHDTPFSRSLLYPQPMAGVEVLANTIATLKDDLAPRRLVREPWMNALIVSVLGLTVAGLMNRTQKPLNRALIASSGFGLWALISYGSFVGARTILIAGTPLVSIFANTLLDFGVGFTADRLKRKRLRTTLARYATSPLVQEIISQQDDFQDLLAVNRADIIGALLRDRYRIVKVLGAGGFGETYLAQDTLRPGNPVCVVKQLKIVSDNPKSHRLAQRLFEAEAVVLGKLGEHSQIPRLLAYFEVQQSFYLVQEMIVGKLLRNILSRSRPLSQRAVVAMLRDLLPVIGFVHSQGVIHRDIKPSNIIFREADRRYVLIDFGAVKTISNQLAGKATQITSTVGIGTQGYMPSEQSAGMPTVRSDLYALGITAIEALTGRPPHALKRSDSGEIIWSHMIADISPALSGIINKMVRYDFNQRYQTAQRVMDDLASLDDSQLANAAIANGKDFPEYSETTYNQGTRPGVIATNPELGSTQLLPSDWPNRWPRVVSDLPAQSADLSQAETRTQPELEWPESESLKSEPAPEKLELETECEKDDF